MGKGFLPGVLWGSVSGVAVLAVLSLYAPLSADRSEELLLEAEASEDQALLDTENAAEEASVVAAPDIAAEETSDQAPVAVAEPEEIVQDVSTEPEEALVEPPEKVAEAAPVAEPEATVEKVVIVEVTPTQPKPEETAAVDEAEIAENEPAPSEAAEEQSNILVLGAPEASEDERPIGIVIFEPEDKTPELQSDAPAELTEVAPVTEDQPRVERVVEIDTVQTPAITAAPATELAESIGQTPVDPAIDPATPSEPAAVADGNAPILDDGAAVQIAEAPQPIPVNSPAVQVLPGQEGTTAPLIEITQGTTNRSTLPRIEPEAEPSEDEPAAQPDAGSAASSADQPIAIGVPSTPRASTGVVTGRLPSLGGGTAGAAALAVVQSGDALRSFAAEPVPGTGEGGVMSVVLIDAGAEGMAIEQLTELAFPFSVAIDPTASDAGNRAAAYRAAGIEVLALPADIPQAASASDVTVAMASYFNTLPEAVAVLDTIDGRLQSNRGLLTPVLSVLQETGHGIVTFSRGLNSAQQAARRAEVESGAVFRVLDDADESAMTIKRTLDRAGFNAARDGSVILLGHTYPQTVTTILEWSLDAKSATLSMVPVSQVLIGSPSS